ncbi:MAG: hypothetical protein ACRD9L_21300, partial [Bryobacteraceae bacterium]
PPGSAASGPAEALLHPVMLRGNLLEPLPPVESAREYAREALRKLPGPCRSLFVRDDCYRVEHSAELLALADRVQRGLRSAIR